MVEQQIPDIQLFCQFTGILYSGMVLLIRVKYIPLRVQAECFVQKPFAAAGILFFAVIIDGKYEVIRADRAKNTSSLRSLPLVPNIREKLLALKEQQKEDKRVCGDCYSKEYEGYVFVDAMGNLFNPKTLTAVFSRLLEKAGLRHIRFHDLRHSCASLLLANDVPMKQIQEWLGHSDISTTANIYSHLDYKSKLTSANVMDNILSLPDSAQPGWRA